MIAHAKPVISLAPIVQVANFNRFYLKILVSLSVLLINTLILILRLVKTVIPVVKHVLMEHQVLVKAAIIKLSCLIISA